MDRFRFLFLLILVPLLASCNAGLEGPEAVGSASPSAVALSLSTVNPEDSLHLFEYDSSASLDIQEEDRWRENNTTWIDFSYASPMGGRVPARLVIPDGKGPFPGLILQHGGPGILGEMVDFARAFADYGAVSIMITSPYRRPGGWEITQYMGNTWPIFTDRDIEIKIQTINDLQRAVDILVDRPEVDPERLAYFGVSWGGSMGGLLAGVEHRLLAYVLVVGDGGLVEHTADPGDDGLNVHFSENWAARMWPTEPLHFVGRAAPAALLFQNGLHDTFVTPHDAQRFYTAASEPKTMIWYDAGHNLPWEFVRDAADWLQPYLGKRLYLTGPDYRPGAVIMDRAILLAVALSAVVYLVDSFRRKHLSWGERLVWLLGMLPLGPFGLLLYWLVPRPEPELTQSGPSTPRWRTVFGITITTTLAFIIGLFIGDKLNATFYHSDFRLRFLQLYLVILVIAWLQTTRFNLRCKISIPALLLAMNLFWVVVMLFPTLIREVYNIPTWLLYLQEMLVGILVTFPLHAWMLERNMELWNPSDVRETRLGKSPWPLMTALLMLSYLAVLGSLVVVVQVYSGLPWKDAFQVLIGLYA